MKFTGTLTNVNDVSQIAPATQFGVHVTVPGTGNVVVEYSIDDVNWYPTGFTFTKTQYQFIEGYVSSPLRLRLTAVTGDPLSYVIRTN